MLFWSVAALLTVGASLAVLLPLARPRDGERPAEANDLEVYRDQLAELDRDAARGLIQPAEAEQARAEIARRILQADGRAREGAPQGRAGRTLPRIAATAAILAVPLVSWGIYAAIGSPGLPSQPLAERLAKNPAESTVDELVARAEAHLAANPSDGRGWDVLAPIYLRLGRYGEAVNAYRATGTRSYWTAPYGDLMGEGLVITCSRVLVDPAGEVLGVTALDLSLKDVAHDYLRPDPDQPLTRATLVDRQGRVMISSGELPREAPFPDPELVQIVTAGRHPIGVARRPGAGKVVAWQRLTLLEWTLIVEGRSGD